MFFSTHGSCISLDALGEGGGGVDDDEDDENDEVALI